MEILKEDNFLLQVVKGVVTSLLITIIGVLLFALVLSITDLGDGVIKPVNQIIKLSAVFLGCFFAIKGDKGFIKGGLIGLFSTILTILIFSLLSGVGCKVLGAIIDVVCGLLMGTLSGAITVNLKKN